MRAGPELRQYQRDSIRRVRRHVAAGLRLVVLAAPTGAGKTIIAAAIILSAYIRMRCVVFFAHRRELICQTYVKLIDAGIPENDIGVMMANDPRTRPTARIQIVSIDTWRHREPPPAHLVIFDECHRSLARTHQRAIDHYSATGSVVIGLSATPYRADNRGLGSIYQALEVVATPRELIAQGFLTEPRVFSVPQAMMPDLTGVRVRGGDYVESDLAAAMNRSGLVGDIVEHWQRLAEGRRTVVFATGVAHSKAITAKFVAAGIPAEHLDGTTPIADRDAILARLESGATLVVSNCAVLCEGWDMPSVKCAILARPTKSTGLYIQCAGRILRPWNGVSALILDHAGNALRHGLPQDDRVLSLDQTPEHSGGEAPTKACPECYAVVALGATECPECGHIFERRKRDEVDASRKLSEIDPNDAAIEARRRRRAGLCTSKMAAVLERRGLSGDVPFELAREAITALAESGWQHVPNWIHADPRFARLAPGLPPNTPVRASAATRAALRAVRT